MSFLVFLDLGLIFLLAAYLFVQLLLLAGLWSYSPPKPKSVETIQWPAVTVLVPARNEAHQIASCIQSLKKLDYPKDKIQILLGDDQSQDNTAQVIKSEIEGDERFKYVLVDNQHGKARAKANVLAHLIQLSSNPFILVTDADIQVKPSWVKSMWPLFSNPQIGILSQATLVEGPSFFDQMQQLEWMLGFGNIIGFEQLGLKSTAVGNNMAFSRDAYLSTGGYENIPFSVTEDFQLFRFIRKQGYEGKTHASPQGLNVSSAQKQLKAFLHQRKRWLIGARELPFIWKLIFFLQGSFFPALLILLFIHTRIAFVIWLFKFIFQSLFMLRMSRTIQLPTRYFLWPLFEVYQQISVLLMLAFYLLPIKMNWKNRNYS